MQGHCSSGREVRVCALVWDVEIGVKGRENNQDVRPGIEKFLVEQTVCEMMSNLEVRQGR